MSIWNLSSIHQDTEGAGKEPKAKQVKLWLWPEKRGTLATVAPNSTDNGRTENPTLVFEESQNLGENLQYRSRMTALERACDLLLLFPEQVNSV